MSETFTALATRALSDDFDIGLLTKARDFAREAVRELYRTTRMHRGDIPMTLQNLAANATFLTIAGTAGSASAAYIEAIVFADNGDDIAPMELADLLRMRGQFPGATGRPELFAVSAGDPTTEATVIELFPKTDRAYQVFVSGASEPDASQLEDTDPVPLPDAWTKLAYYYVRGELFALEGDDSMFSFWNTRWINGSAAMRSDLQRTTRGNRIVPGTWAGMASAAPSFTYKGQRFGG